MPDASRERREALINGGFVIKQLIEAGPATDYADVECPCCRYSGLVQINHSIAHDPEEERICSSLEVLSPPPTVE